MITAIGIFFLAIFFGIGLFAVGIYLFARKRKRS
ncbi:hypothetical protein BH10ACI2_BH10ACI2_17050 [soil metagenome]